MTNFVVMFANDQKWDFLIRFQISAGVVGGRTRTRQVWAYSSKNSLKPSPISFDSEKVFSLSQNISGTELFFFHRRDDRI